jgi:hypothetical protein
MCPDMLLQTQVCLLTAYSIALVICGQHLKSGCVLSHVNLTMLESTEHVYIKYCNKIQNMVINIYHLMQILFADITMD